MRRFSRLFFVTLFLAVVVRLFLLFWSLPLNENGDQRRYEEWAQVAHIYNFADTYTTKYVKIVPNNEPPGSLYIISGTYETYILIGKVIARVTHTAAGSILFVNTYLLHLVMRIPSLITDLLMGALAYLLVAKEKGQKRGLLAASLLWFNPVIFYNSSVWGQMDSLNNFFFLLSLFLVFQKHYILSIISFALSIYIKLSLLPLIPFYFVFLFFHSQKKWKPLFLGSMISIIIVVMSTFPISANPIAWLITTIPAISGGELQNMTNAAFNFWWAVTCGPLGVKTCSNNIPITIDVFMRLQLQVWAYMLFGLTTLPILYLQIKKSKLFTTKYYVFFSLGLVAIMAFLFLPKMHDRYLYPCFPLLAIAIALSKSARNYMILFGILVSLHMGNIIYSWYPTYFPVFIIYQIIYSNLYRWSISALIVIIGFILYKKSLTEFFKKRA